jgi:hypothetical protein
MHKARKPNVSRNERTTIYVAGTELPLLIKQSGHKSALLYEFKYEK